MSPTVHLAADRPWTVTDGVSVRGRAFDGDDLLAGESLADRFAGVDSLEAFADTLDGLAGFFAVVVERPDALLLGVDHVRSVTLLYAPGAGLAGDDPHLLADRLDEPSDPLAESELLVGGNVLGDRTLFRGLRTVRPGEAVRLADDAVETHRYTSYLPRTDAAVDDPAATETFESALDAAFDRLSAVVGDRQVVLTLSGGYDSRLVAAELAARGHDALAVSFGRPDAEDVRVAREVARALGLPWEFVEYSTEGWREWYRSPERAAVVDATFTCDAIPNYGAAPALCALRERGVVDPDAVTLSGQTVAGMSENVPPELDRPAPTTDDVVDAVLRYWARWDWENPAFDAVVRERIRATLPPDPETASLPAAFARYEHWKWAERHVKYFVADVRVAGHLGLDWWLPLWDRAVVDAWADLPFALRRGKAFYRAVVDRRFAAASGADAADPAATTVRTAAPTLPGRAVDWAADRVVDSPVAPLLRGLYWRLQRARSAYGDHPLGWYGIVPPDLFAELYSGREDVHALQSLETVGRASFLEGTVTDPPREGVLALPYRVGDSG